MSLSIKQFVAADLGVHTVIWYHLLVIWYFQGELKAAVEMQHIAYQY